MSSPVFAAIFVVPDDRALVEKSAAIIAGTVTGSRSQLRDDGDVETIYSVRIERTLKGSFRRGSTIAVTSPGGHVEKRWTLVPGSAHFRRNDEVVLFLVRHEGRWTTTDMTLGKFRFVTSTGGQSLLVRDAEDIVGFDREMRTHVEKIRSEAGFLKFIEEMVRGRDAQPDYFVAPGEAVSLPAAETRGIAAAALRTYTARSYALHFHDGQHPGRWPESRMSAATTRPFFKNESQNASELADGGVAMITSSLDAWTSDCPSSVNLAYGGTTSASKDGADGANVIVWNDPGNHIPGSWEGSGVAATAFLTGDDFHTFEGLTNGWLSFSDADIVVQDGVAGSYSLMATAMTHEIGHALGLRHSNTHHDGSSCQPDDECEHFAVMTAWIDAPWNYTLRRWDQNAIRALYPAACLAPPDTPIGVSAFSTSGSSVTIQWTESAGATSYKLFRRSSTAAAYAEVASGVSGSPYTDSTVTSATSYQYFVRAINEYGESGDSDPDFTTAISFTDGPLVIAGSTIVKLVHVTDAATAINALRTLGGLEPFAFTGDAPAYGAPVRASHFTDMHDALNEAYTAIGAGGIVFSTFGSTIRAQDINTLRILTR